MFIDITNHSTVSFFQLVSIFPQVSFSSPPDLRLLEKLGFRPIHSTSKPIGDVVIELPPKLIEGKWYQQWKVRDYTDEELADLIEQEKEEALIRINKGYAHATSSLEADYPVSERESWHIQVAEARAWQSDPNADTPWVDAAAQARDIPREALIKLILEQDDRYRTQHGQLTGRRQALRDRVHSLNEISRHTLEVIKAIGWSTSDE